MNFGPAQTTDPPASGYKPLVVGVSVGPSQKEKGGISIASDVVKVQVENLGTPSYSRGGRTRRYVGASPLAGCVHLGSLVGTSPLARSQGIPGTVTIPHYRFDITKQHTPCRVSSSGVVV